MKALGRVLFLALVLIAESAFAAQGGTATMFLNGVKNTETQAMTNLRALKIAKISELAEAGRGGMQSYGLLYNVTDGVGDFVEVMRQKLQEQ